MLRLLRDARFLITLGALLLFALVLPSFIEVTLATDQEGSSKLGRAPQAALVMLSGGEVDLQSESFYQGIQEVERLVREEHPGVAVQSEHISRWEKVCDWIKDTTTGVFAKRPWLLVRTDQRPSPDLEKLYQCIDTKRLNPSDELFWNVETFQGGPPTELVVVLGQIFQD